MRSTILVSVTLGISIGCGDVERIERDFVSCAELEDVGEADALVFPEVTDGCVTYQSALIGSETPEVVTAVCNSCSHKVVLGTIDSPGARRVQAARPSGFDMQLGRVHVCVVFVSG